MTNDVPETTEPVLVYDGTDYIASYTTYVLDNGPMVMFHLDVFYFSHTVLRDMEQKWAVFRSVFKNPIFCHLEDDTERGLRFLSRFGFVPVGEVPCTDGKSRRVYVHLVIEE